MMRDEYSDGKSGMQCGVRRRDTQLDQYKGSSDDSGYLDADLMCFKQEDRLKVCSVRLRRKSDIQSRQ